MVYKGMSLDSGGHLAQKWKWGEQPSPGWSVFLVISSFLHLRQWDTGYSEIQTAGGIHLYINTARYGARARAGGTCLVAVLRAASVIGCWGRAAGAASVIVCW